MTHPWRGPGSCRSVRTIEVRGKQVMVSQAINPSDVCCSMMVGPGGSDKILQAGPLENRDHGRYLWANVRHNLGTQRGEGWEG